MKLKEQMLYIYLYFFFHIYINIYRKLKEQMEQKDAQMQRIRKEQIDAKVELIGSSGLV